MKQKRLMDFFLRVKPFIMLAKLNGSKETYASVLAKEVDCTYSYMVRVLQELRNRKIINFEKRGRTNIITLTQSGKEIAECFSKLCSIFKKIK